MGNRFKCFFVCLCVFLPIIIWYANREWGEQLVLLQGKTSWSACLRAVCRTCARNILYLFVCIILLVHAILVQIFSAKVLFCLRGLSHSVDDGSSRKFLYYYSLMCIVWLTAWRIFWCIWWWEWISFGFWNLVGTLSTYLLGKVLFFSFYT